MRETRNALVKVTQFGASYLPKCYDLVGVAATSR